MSSDADHPRTTMDLTDLALAQFELSKREYERNKNGRQNEKWFDWTPLPPRDEPIDELDKLVLSPYASEKRNFTPWIKKREMNKDKRTIQENYADNVLQAERVKRKLAYRPTSIFGGAIAVSAGRGWRDFVAAPPIAAGHARDVRFQKKFDSSSFPQIFNEHCNNEFKRMNKKALSQK